MKLGYLLAGGAVLYWLMNHQQNPNDVQSEDVVDTALTAIDEATGLIMTSPVGSFSTSDQMIQMLKSREALKLTRYALGDGGYTIGYGHFETNINNIPETITADQANDMFVNDLVNRGEKWVKLYVNVDLTQNQFDALVSIAYNMSPQSFKKFAASVNVGNGIDDIAAQSVGWVSAQFTNGIRNRRNAEVNVFNNGIYA